MGFKRYRWHFNWHFISCDDAWWFPANADLSSNIHMAAPPLGLHNDAIKRSLIQLWVFPDQ